MNIMTVGGATQDIIINYKDAHVLHRSAGSETQSFLLLQEGKKIDVDDIQYYSGGGATNSAVSFARLGCSVSIFCTIGTDYQGQFILHDLAKENIATNLMLQHPNVITNVSFIVAGPSGDKTTLVYRGASTSITPQELPLTALATTDLLYITSLSGPAMDVLPTLVAAAKKHACYVVANPGNSQLKSGATLLQNSLRNIDILMVNRFEASLLMHSIITESSTGSDVATRQAPDKPQLYAPIMYKNIQFTLVQFFKELLARGPKIVVVTNGSEGVYAATQEGILFHPSLPVKVVSTLGAGDAFGSCFSASLLSGHSLEDAVRYGVLNSTSVIQYPDAKTGLLSGQALEKQFALLDKDVLQKYAL